MLINKAINQSSSQSGRRQAATGAGGELEAGKLRCEIIKERRRAVHLKAQQRQIKHQQEVKGGFACRVICAAE